MAFRIGDHGPQFRPFQEFLNRKFASYSKLKIDEYYGLDEAKVVAQAMRNYGMAPSFMDVTLNGVPTRVEGAVATDEFLQRASWKPPAPDRSHLPLYISIEGHLSNMWIGPSVEVGRILEQEGLVQLQPTGYNNGAIPFDNESGVREVVRFFRDTNLMPPGRKFCLGQFSQGDIVGTQFFMRYVLPTSGEFHHRLKDWVGTLAFGAPFRPKDVVAPWIPDPPRPGTQGISDVRMPVGDHLDKIMYVCRHGDLYTENEDDAEGRKKTAIYKAVQGDFIGKGSIFWELLAIGMNPTVELIATARAIADGVMFLGNMDKHGGYDLGPCIDWMRGQVLAARRAA